MWRFKLPLAIGTTLTLATALTLGLSNEAEACGGTFCDGGFPGSMPVNQTGETILFAIDNGYVEAHVQIEYDGGDATQFAWLVPVPEVPDIEVGSWRLVQSALAGSRPVYGFEDNWMCEDMPPPPPGGGGFIQRPDGGGASGEPDVVAQDVVGAFEYAVLQGGTSETVTDWLLANGYTVEEDAPTILDDYIDEGHVFVAFRLRHGQGVEDIHPVVIRYPGTEPCIPIRLTRVAAEEDMAIRALFLGEARVVPTTYRHVLLNRTRLNWLGFGNNYDELVSMAVDAPGADGRAFVTEYAGSTDVIDPAILDTSAYVSSVFADVPVVDVVGILEDQGLVACAEGGTCNFGHELISSVLHEFIPVPEGVDEADFYACLSCYAGAIDEEAWDAAAFMAAYDERIVAPLDHARDLVETWPYLTRLYTRISPNEMITDPMFTENPDLDDVANRNGAERQQECCGNTMRLPGGRMVTLQGGGWPDFGDTMPWAERVEEFTSAGGAPIVLSDEAATIDQVLAEWNEDWVCNDPGATGSGTGMPGNDSTTDPGGGGMSDDSGVPPTSTAGQDDEGATAGCACNSKPRGGVGGWMLMLAGFGLGALRRRRAR